MSADVRVRKRIPKSCRRCHRRKQRCVGFPTCSSCQSANQPCTRAEASPSWHHAMSKEALAHRIEVLEAQLAALSDHSRPPVDDQRSPSPLRATQLSPHTPDDASQNIENNVVSLIAMIHKGSNGSHGSSYLGPSSGMSIAENVGRIVHDTLWTNSIPVDATYTHPVPDLSRTGPNEGSIAPPNDNEGSRLLKAYFKNMHVRLPFLNRTEILDLHANRNQTPGATPEDQFGQFKLFMVYAIGAVILQMTEEYDATPPGAFLETALAFESSLRKSLSLTGLEAVLLLVLYHLRSSSSSKVWYMLGLAMRICVDFGLHREVQYRKLGAHEAQKRRRLFWSVYIIERYNAWSLGRPFSIAEQEIDADLPADLDDSITDDKIIEHALRNLPSPREPSPGPNLRRFIACIQLQRISSLVHTRMYRVDKDVSMLLPEVGTLMAALEEYERDLPWLAPADDDFVRMHWNSAIRMLLQPLLSILPSQDPLIQTCLSASGRMCQLFKQLRQRDSSGGYSFLLANSVFMAGLTMCFCLFRSPDLWTTTVSNDLRACSSAMFFMAERNSALKMYRDGLEMVINRAMDFVNETEESERRPNPNDSSEALLPENPFHTSTESDNVPISEWSDLGSWFDFQNPFYSLPDDFEGETRTGVGFERRVVDGIFMDGLWDLDGLGFPSVVAD